jgi:hypothetical protein
VDYCKLRYVYTFLKNHAISIHSRFLYVSIDYRGLNNVVIYEKTTRKAKTLARNRVIAGVFDYPIGMVLANSAKWFPHGSLNSRTEPMVPRIKKTEPMVPLK